MKYLIVGLGNPGIEYSQTRHNIGFKVLDAIAEASDTFFLSKRYADYAQIKYKGRILVLIKPMTYMNLSGKAIRYWLEKEKLSIENLLVISDDIAIPFGTIRVRDKGSDGGHNGLANIISVLNTTQFNRLRFGIGSEFSKGQQVDYVIGKWTEDEEAVLGERIKKMIGAVKNFSTVGIKRTMNFSNEKYNFEEALKKIKSKNE